LKDKRATFSNVGSNDEIDSDGIRISSIETSVSFKSSAAGNDFQKADFGKIDFYYY
jgi:hypothetical protein